MAQIQFTEYITDLNHVGLQYFLKAFDSIYFWTSAMAMIMSAGFCLFYLIGLASITEQIEFMKAQFPTRFALHQYSR